MRRCWGAPAYFFAWFISDFSRYLLSTSTDWLFLFYRPPFFVVVWAAKDGIKSPVRTVTSVASKPLLQQQPSRKSSGVSEMCPFILFFCTCCNCGVVIVERWCMSWWRSILAAAVVAVARIDFHHYRRQYLEWLLLLLLALMYLLLLFIFMSQSNRSGKASRTISGAASTEDPGSLLGPDCSPSQLAAGSGSSLTSAGITGISAAGGSHDGSLKGKGTKTTTRWSGLFGSTYKVNRIAFRRNFHCF